MKRRLWQAVVLCSATVGVTIWFGFVDPWRRHRDFCQTVRAELETLAKKRPDGLSRNQWNNVVGWTIHGEVDILRPTRSISRAKMDRFEAELRLRLQGPVDLATIDWIWDEFEQLAPYYGPLYVPKWRPTSPEKLREFDKGGTWLNVEVD